MTDFDAIIIGAGHNGLVCAGYLAKAGKKVLVLESRAVPGGCAATHEFAPGFSVSSCASSYERALGGLRIAKGWREVA